MRTQYAAARACCLAIAAFVLLAGCSDRSLSQDARFNADAAGGAEGKGLIVVGLRIAREPVRHSWLLGDQHQHPTYHIWLGNITDEGKLGRPFQEMTVCEAFRSSSSGLLSDCVPGRLRYKVLAVPPGRYGLGGIKYAVARVTSITAYMRRPRLDGSSEARMPRYGDLIGNPEQSFTVRAGEIAYVGDLNFDFEPRSSSASLVVSRNDGEARAAMASYPNIHGDIVFRSIGGAGVKRIEPPT